MSTSPGVTGQSRAYCALSLPTGRSFSNFRLRRSANSRVAQCRRHTVQLALRRNDAVQLTRPVRQPHTSLCGNLSARRCQSQLRAATLPRSVLEDLDLEVSVEVKEETPPKVGDMSTLELKQQLEIDAAQLLEACLKDDNIPNLSAASLLTLELGVLLCSDKYITELNNDTFGRDCPTDVLSFPLANWGQEEEEEWEAGEQGGEVSMEGVELDSRDDLDEDAVEFESEFTEEELSALLGSADDDDDDFDEEEFGEVPLPPHFGFGDLLLGDLVISVDTAAKQAAQQGHSVLDEARILLTHGLLHLLGFDHEGAPDAKQAMAAQEQRLLAAMGWPGVGLVTSEHTISPDPVASSGGTPLAAKAKAKAAGAAKRAAGGLETSPFAGLSDLRAQLQATEAAAAAPPPEEEGGGELELPEAEVETGRPAEAEAEAGRAAELAMGDEGELSFPEVRLLALDMDGTLLSTPDSGVGISEANVEAIRAAQAAGVVVVVATGKARAAAISACARHGLTGSDGLVDTTTPGVFTQGLLVYGEGGAVVAQEGNTLPDDVVKEGFAYAQDNSIATTTFHLDKCMTLAAHPYLDELHTKYHEPRAQVADSVQEMLGGKAFKLLFMAEPLEIEAMRGHWTEKMQGRAEITQAVPSMLELLPLGASKGKGLQLLANSLGIHMDQVMAIGDGDNDIEMLEKVGLAVAMGNATPGAVAVADVVVADNDSDGVAEAINRFILQETVTSSVVSA